MEIIKLSRELDINPKSIEKEENKRKTGGIHVSSLLQIGKQNKAKFENADIDARKIAQVGDDNLTEIGSTSKKHKKD